MQCHGWWLRCKSGVAAVREPWCRSMVLLLYYRRQVLVPQESRKQKAEMHKPAPTQHGESLQENARVAAWLWIAAKAAK